MATLRPYQQETIQAIMDWYVDHNEIDQIPILQLPTGAGKSIIIAALVELFFKKWPEQHPRTLVIVPSKELAEQNAGHLDRVLPKNVSLGYYSASVGEKNPDADVIVATIGSVAKKAHLLGDIKMVIIDECHRVNPDGAGQYRSLINNLRKYCDFRVIGLTATPFRGDGIWLTDGTDPLFTSIAHKVSIGKLIEEGYLAPLVLPDKVITQIDTSNVAIDTTGDYKIDELSRSVEQAIENVAAEAITLAAERRKWIAFTPTVGNAQSFARHLNNLGVTAQVVTGDTPKKEREALISQFKKGEIRCLVSVIALTTGFDVPDIDALLWLRPTTSKVLYIQGAGRGTRIAPGKNDCLWLDFSDTTARLGPIDALSGRPKIPPSETNRDAPFATCTECGFRVIPASLMYCPECDAQLREEEPKFADKVSLAAVLSQKIIREPVRHEVNRVSYSTHLKPGKRPSMRVDYWSGIRRVASEYICFEHGGYVTDMAVAWWLKRDDLLGNIPTTTQQAIEWSSCLKEPTVIFVDVNGDFPRIIQYEFESAKHSEASIV